MNYKIYKAVFLILLIGFTACSENSNGNSESSGTENEAELSPEGTEKLNILVDIFNSFSTSSYDSYNDYASSFGEDPEQFVTHKDWYNGEDIYENTMAKLKSLDEAVEIDIYEDLDPLIKEYQRTALNLAKILNESYPYYDMKDYETDDFEKAKTYHEPTLIAYNEFFEVDNLLRNMSDSIQTELELVYLNGLKENGDVLGYLVGMSINKAEQMLDATQDDEYENLDWKNLESAYGEVRGVLDELTQFKMDKPDEFNANREMSWFYDALKDFVKASKELSNRKKENRPFSTGEKMNLNPSSGWMVNGSTYQVLRKYNDLINKYNSMIN